MIGGDSCLAKDQVALRANKFRILFLLIKFEIQNSTIVCGSRNVTAVSASTRADWNFHRCRIDRVEGGHVMTAEAVQVWMLTAFMTKRAGRNSPAPPCEDKLIRNPHLSSQLCIEISDQTRSRRPELVANIAVLRLGRNSGISVMAGEADRMAVGDGFKRAFL